MTPLPLWCLLVVAVGRSGGPYRLRLAPALLDGDIGVLDQELESLRPQDITADHAVPPCAQRFADVLGLAAQPLRLPADLRLDFLVGGLDALGRGDRLEHQLGLHRPL